MIGGRTWRAIATSAWFVVVISLSACGGSDATGAPSSGASDSASASAAKSDFCTAYTGLFASLTQAGGDQLQAIAVLKKWAADMEIVGPPDDMPQDARRGFELLINTAKDIDDDATLEELTNLGESFDADQRKDGDAFSAWATEQCPMDLSGLPTGVPTGSP